MAFPFGGGLALIRPQFGRSIRVGGVGTPVYGTSSQFEPSGVARFRTQPDVDGAALSPTFSVDWTTATSLPSQVTLSATSARTYWDSSGVLATAASGVARIEYNPATLVQQGLLLEEQRTNLVIQSTDVSNAAFAVNNATQGSDATVDPRGTTAVKLTAAATVNSFHEEYQGPFTISSGSTYTYSIYAKAGTNNFVYINLQDGGTGTNNFTGIFNLSGTADIAATQTSAQGTGTLVSASSKYVGGGWFRIFITGSISPTSAYIEFGLASAATGNTINSTGELPYVAAGTESVYFALPQLELGSFPTSAIITTTAAATRSAEIATSTDAVLLAANGWVVEVGELQPSTASTLLGINTAIGLGETTGNALTTADGGTQTSGNTGTWTSLNRGGIAWDSTPRVSIDLDGGTVVTAANTPATPTSLYLGNTNNGASGFLNGHLRMMAAYAAVSDSQLAIISAVGASFIIAGATTNDAVGAAAGTSTVAAIGASLAASTGTATGTSTVAAVGASLAAATGAAAGISTVTATGKALFNGIGSAAGASTVTATGAALANSVGNAAGTSTVLATGRSIAATTGASAGVSTISGVGAALAASVGSAAGTSTDVATGASIAKSVGNATGTSTALGVSGTVGAAVGTSTVTGVGSALFKAVGAAAGTSTVTATGVGASFAVGVSSGTSTVSGIGKSLAVAVGSAAGVGTAAGLSPSLIVQAVGLATGNSIVVGVGNAHRPGTWQIAIRGTMDISTPWKIGNTAIDTIPNVPGVQSIYSDSTPDIYQVGDIYSQTAQNTWKVATRGNMDVQTAWKIAR